jgi:hypothetical protein
MNCDVVEARYLGRYVIWLRFRDNTSGEIDLEKELYGPGSEVLYFREQTGSHAWT